MSPDDWLDKERLIIQRIKDLQRKLKRVISPHLARPLSARIRRLKHNLTKHRRKYSQIKEPTTCE